MTTFLASLAIVSSILAFTQHTQIPWKLIDGICWLIQGVTFVTIASLIIHEKKFQAVTHSFCLRAFLVVNFIITALLAFSSIVRLSYGISNTNYLKSEDMISIISQPCSAFLLIVSISGSNGITVTTKYDESVTIDGNDNNVRGYASSSILSQAFWLWMNPLLTKGFENPLRIEDIPTLSSEHRAEKWSKLFEQNWPTHHETFTHLVGTTLIRCFWKDIAFMTFLAIVRLCVTYDAKP